MDTMPKEIEELTIDKCFGRLETLFRYMWEHDHVSDFNYQLSVRNSPFNTLKKLVSWRPIYEYFDGKHGWAIVQFEEIKTGFRGLPHIVEFNPHDSKWHIQGDDGPLEYYLNADCKPIAFMELKKYEEIQPSGPLP